MIHEQRVRDWMSPNPVTVPASTTLPEAHKIMEQRKIRRLLVVDGDKLLGIITRGDVRGAQPSDATSLSIWEINYLLSRLTVERIMTTDMVTVSADAPIREAARLMLEKKIAGLPVVDNDKLVGIITESDIFRLVAQSWTQESA